MSFHQPPRPLDDTDSIIPDLLMTLMASIDPGTLSALAFFLVLLFLSALYSSAEVAFFSLTPARLAEMKEDPAIYGRVTHLLEKPNKEQAPKLLLATILVANNFVNIALVLLSTKVLPLIEPDADYWAGMLSISPEFFSLVFSLTVVTLVLVLFGEIIPKVYATNNNMKLALVLALPILLTSRIFRPLTSILIKSTGFFEKRYRNRQTEISIDDLSNALELTNSEDRTRDEQKILEGIVSFGSKSVKQVMTPRIGVDSLSVELGFKDLIAGILHSGFSRIPIFKGSLDEVVGILYIKDVLPHIDLEDFDWQPLIRPAMVVPEGKKIDDLLKEFQNSRVHLALVVDEYGGTSGLITLEDILEEIIGDITDEFDEEHLHYSKLDDDNFVFEGRISLMDFYKIMEIDGSSFERNKGESDSLAGFLLELSGKIPRKGEKISFGDLMFTIESADRRKVKQIKVTRLQNPTE